VNILERITLHIERARVRGGWDDEVVAAEVLTLLGLGVNGEPVAREGEVMPPDATPSETTGA
jgi:hypothetical protein